MSSNVLFLPVVVFVVHIVLITEEILQSDDEVDSDDFRPNIVMLSDSPPSTSADQSDVNPMQGIQFADFAVSGDEVTDNNLNNSDIGEKVQLLSLKDKDVKSITNDLSQEIATEDEVEEDIVEEDIQENIASEVGGRGKKASERNRSVTPVSRSSHGSTIKSAENSHSYTEDFSVASDQTSSKRSTSRSSTSRTSTSSRKSESGRDSRSIRSSRSYSSRSHSSKSYDSRSYSSWSSCTSRSASHREHSSHKSKVCYCSNNVLPAPYFCTWPY